MTTQPEQVLENNLIKQLVGLGYEQVKVTDDSELVANFKIQLERLNNTSLTDHKFKQILNSINKEKTFSHATQFPLYESNIEFDNLEKVKEALDDNLEILFNSDKKRYV